MTTFGFGQRSGQVVQIAYTVQRIRPAIDWLIPATTGMDEMFTRYWKASLDWNGQDPIRPFG